MLPRERCLLVIRLQDGSLQIYLERLGELEKAVEIGAAKKNLRKDKIGDDFLFAFDENKRMVAVFSNRGFQVSWPHVDTIDILLGLVTYFRVRRGVCQSQRQGPTDLSFSVV